MTRRTRTVLAAVTLWLVIVAGTSTAAWLVIDRAGREVFTTDATVPTEPARAATPVSTGPPATRAPSPSHTRSATPTSTRPAPRPTPARPATTTPTRPSTAHPSTSPSPPPPSPPTVVSDSITVSGGTVGVSCQGSTITLRYVTPRNGWSYEIDRSSRSIEVKFSRQGAEDEAEVHATCSGGHPVFEHDSGGAGDEHD